MSQSRKQGKYAGVMKGNTSRVCGDHKRKSGAAKRTKKKEQNRIMSRRHRPAGSDVSEWMSLVPPEFLRLLTDPASRFRRTLTHGTKLSV